MKSKRRSRRRTRLSRLRRWQGEKVRDWRRCSSSLRTFFLFSLRTQTFRTDSLSLLSPLFPFSVYIHTILSPSLPSCTCPPSFLASLPFSPSSVFSLPSRSFLPFTCSSWHTTTTTPSLSPLRPFFPSTVDIEALLWYYFFT
jgi:hypothetical protein